MRASAVRDLTTGYYGRQGEHMVAVENSATIAQRLVVCITVLKLLSMVIAGHSAGLVQILMPIAHRPVRLTPRGLVGIWHNPGA